MRFKPYYDELVEQVRNRRTLFLAGTGVSLAATGGSQHASWTGLIADGLKVCHGYDSTLPDDWSELRIKQLGEAGRRGDLVELIATATLVERKLGGADRKGGNWRSWLRSTVGRMQISDRRVPDALVVLGQTRLATCNYDDVLSRPDLPPIPWTDTADAVRVLSGEEPGVLHLHGHWKSPDSVVLGYDAYASVLASRSAQILQSAIAAVSSIVFVGFGDGLEDPNLGSLMQWMGETFRERESHHFRLALASEVASLQKRSNPDQRIALVPYGNSFEDLAPFLERLAEDAGIATTNSATTRFRPRVDRLILDAGAATRDEIARTTQKKYVELLYVQREVEAVVGSWLVDDSGLGALVVGAREVIFAAISRTIDDFRGRGTKLHSRLADGLRAIRRPVDEAFERICMQGRPCEAQCRKQIQEIVLLLGRATNLAGAEAADLQSTIASTMGSLKRFEGHIAIIVDRAGGGKTNLLCRLALDRVDSEPVVFLPGRIRLEQKDSLLVAILRRLGWNDAGQSRSDFLTELDTTLSASGKVATVLIDGINENRELGLFNTAMHYAATETAGVRIRFVLSCRDIYWRFFQSEAWVKAYACNEVAGRLFEFSNSEYEFALDRYLKYFRIRAELGAGARERCRHPLLMRFFCEAYRPDAGSGERNLGRVDDIRLKRLFDDYLDSKVRHWSDSIGRSGAAAVEDCLYSLTSHILEEGITSIPTKEVGRVTGVADVDSASSPYLRLLDEDIIIEESLVGAGHERRTVFVYEEFMEYAIARNVLRQSYAGSESARADQLFRVLDERRGDFVNALGTMMYVCASCVEEKNYSIARRLIFRMASSGGAWAGVLESVFGKHDSALEVLRECAIAGRSGDAAKLGLVLQRVAGESRARASELCATIGFVLAWPSTWSFDDLSTRDELRIVDATGGLPAIEQNPRFGRTLLRAVAKCIVDNNLGAARRLMWLGWSKQRRYVGAEDRRELVRALWEVVGSSPRRSLLASYAVNGLFDLDRDVRRAAALFSRESGSPAVAAIREVLRQRERDPDTLLLLG